MRYLKVLSIAVVKYMPIILAACLVTVLCCYFFNLAIGSAETTWLIFHGCQIVAYLILSKTFRFCIYHRLIIYYVFLVYMAMSFDMYIGLPISNYILYKILLILSGITLIAVIITYLKYGDRKISQKDKLTD